jgi:hypothetical protein
MNRWRSDILRLAIGYFICLGFSNPLGSEEIVIQSDYWTGSQCLTNGVPWQVPDSIYKEAENCHLDDLVLEFGAGGSTVFFARRCKHVISIETDPYWAFVVSSHLKKIGLDNVNIVCMRTQSEIEKFIQQFDTYAVNILSVDTTHGYNRSAFVDRFFEKGISENLRMIVLDNYAAPELFQSHYNKEVVDLDHWSVFKYDDIRWTGNGTKIYLKKGK